MSNGFVVLAVDPVCQGEREQYRDPDGDERIVGGGGGVFAHCYAGQQCFYAGANLARYMIHDARRALDYLDGRPDVDDGRIAATGSSGGGIQTLYLSLADDRIDAVAPCCSVTERREWLKSGKRIDAEQALVGAIPAGINYDDLVTAVAPRPVCVGAARSDEYFPIEGVYETVERAQRVYGLYGAVENVDLVLADETHCSVYELGDGMFEWLCDRLGDEEYEPRGDHRLLDATELHCTPEGSVREAYADERTIDDLIREHVAETRPEATADPADLDVDTGRLRETLTERFGLDRTDCEPHPRYVERDEEDGLSVEHVFFRAERDPDVVVTGVMISDPGSTGGSPAVVLYEEGTGELRTDRRRRRTRGGTRDGPRVRSTRRRRGPQSIDPDPDVDPRLLRGLRDGVQARVRRAPPR